MKSRYSLRTTLYRDAPRIEQVGLSGATAQKIRIAGQELGFVGGMILWETAFGWDSVTHPGASESGPIAVKQCWAEEHQHPRQDQQSALRELCRNERESGSSMVLERNVVIPTAILRSPPTNPARMKLKSLRNWVKPPESSLIFGYPLMTMQRRRRGRRRTLQMQLWPRRASLRRYVRRGFPHLLWEGRTRSP